MNGIMQVKQLPIIEERLKELENDIRQKASVALSLVVTEDNYKEIKKVRAELNKESKELEKLRKKIKDEVLKPYEDFYYIYKDVTKYYDVADRELAKKIKEIEQVLKDEKETEIITYFLEYKKSLLLEYDFITYERVGLKINLSDSLNKLKNAVKVFLDRVNNDINTINSMENTDEIIFEYSKTLELASSISIVNERKKVIEEQKKIKEVLEGRQQKQEKVIQKVEEVQQQLEPPVEDEKEYKVKFTVVATKEKLKELKMFLENGGYKYEQYKCSNK